MSMRPSGAAHGPADYLDSLITVLELIRGGSAQTRPEIARYSGLGRNVVTQRVSQLMTSGLVAEGSLDRSTGGRAARELRFCLDAGAVLVAELGATSIGVGISDLAGKVTHMSVEPADITAGPEVILDRVCRNFSHILADEGASPLWGVGIGLPGPVEFATGRPVAPPIMPGWDGFDVRAFMRERFGVPVWVDNDVNVMALGELRCGLAQGQDDVIYVKVGSGIGAGLVSGGRLHRGAQGCAGDIGHVAIVENSDIVCRCGKAGCLEAVAGGAAIARQGKVAAEEKRSRFLAALLESGEEIEARDVSMAAAHGERLAIELLSHSARVVGDALATLVNFYNPSLILIGGGVTESNDLYLAEVRQSILRRSLPLATRALQVLPSPMGDHAGLRGAAYLVIDQLLSREILGTWIDHGSPAEVTEVAS